MFVKDVDEPIEVTVMLMRLIRSKEWDMNDDIETINSEYEGVSIADYKITDMIDPTRIFTMGDMGFD